MISLVKPKKEPHRRFWGGRHRSSTTLLRIEICYNVVAVDLDMDIDDDGDIDNDDDAIEKTVGAYIFDNWDDDDQDDICDDQDDTVYGENDTVKVVLDLQPSLTTGTLKLESAGRWIKVWENSYKTTEVELPKTWNLATETVPSTLWVEGYEVSPSERDVTLKLSYTKDSFTCADEISITVVDLHIGSAVYRDKFLTPPWILPEYDHTGLVAQYLGKRTAAEIKDRSNYLVYDMQRSGVRTTTSLETFAIEEPPYYGTFRPSYVTNQKRIKILKTLKALESQGISYPPRLNIIPYAVIFNDDDGDGKINSLSDITHLRCDGLVEVCYENSSVPVWSWKQGNQVYTNIMDYPAKHNDRPDFTVNAYTELSPKAQRGAFNNTNTTFRALQIYAPALGN